MSVGSARVDAGSTVRRSAFWLLDRARGAPIRRHGDDIRARMSGGPFNTDLLRDLLVHATRTTAFYRPYAGRGLDDFPVIDKTAIKTAQAEFLSSAFEDARLRRQQTSGSTGTPFSVVQDSGKRRRAIAEIIYFNAVGGMRVGDRLMWVRSAQLMQMSRRQRLVQNVIPVFHVGMDDEAKEQIIERLRRDHVAGIVSPSSALESLARFIDARGHAPDEFEVKAIISIAENLPAEIRHRVESAFGCPVTNRYSNQENGVLASSKPGHDRLYLNRASYYFEFLMPHSDEPQAPGELARVVVTDLYNRAQPMIRYDTGDLAVVSDVGADGRATALATIEGRRIDVIYDTSGGLVSSTWAADVMSKVFPEVERYQLIQSTAASYRLKVVLGQATYEESEFIAELQKWLGSGARVSVEFVTSIPSLASGKYRPVIGEYRPSGNGAA